MTPAFDAMLAALKRLVDDDNIYRETGRTVPRDSGYWALAREAIALAEAERAERQEKT